MNAQGKPGQVAIVTDGGDEYLAFWDAYNETWVSARVGRLYIDDLAVRPLVVIDPEDVEQVRALANAWDDLADQRASLTDEPMTLSALRMQAALREFVADASKPDEPTALGAVIECHYDGKSGTAVYTGAGWTFYGENLVDHSADWYAFDAVRVLSPGVGAAS